MKDNKQINANINSRFNYTVELGILATKNAMKVKKTIKDKIVHILVIVFIILMTGLLIWDISRNASIVMDVIILIALCALEIFNIVMPFIIQHMQKKFLRQVLVAEFDYTLTEIDKDKCLESYYKNGKIVMQNSCDMADLVGYIEDNNYIFLVFNNFATAIFDVNTLQNTTKEEFIKYLVETIDKNRLLKTKKRK